MIVQAPSVPPAGDVPPQPAPAATAASPLDRFTALVGTWDADITGDGAPDTTVDYRLIANGSAVVETLFRDTPHEMITVYHMDGKRLFCTHYCAATNQPRLAATPGPGDTVSFSFVDATNMASPDAMHMNAVSFKFIDPGHVTSTWSSREGGVDGGKQAFVMTRRKN